MANEHFRPTALCICVLATLAACTADEPQATASPAAVAAPAPALPECAIDEALCGPRCVRIVDDVRHCGTCGNACASSEACRLGRCVPAPTVSSDPLRPHDALRCRPDRAACGDVCVDLATSRDHCGACGAACAGTCVAGTCSPGGI